MPLLDVGAAVAELRAGLDEAVNRVLDSGRYLAGPEVEAFEAEFAAYCGGDHCVTVGSGLAALELTLRASGIGPGDDVLVPSHTFIATWLAVSAIGARPVPVEPGAGGVLIDVAGAAAALTPRTAAVVPVHLYGHPVDLPALRRFADRAGLAVVEDAAQAHGARAHGVQVGASPSTAAFSFYPGKNLGALGDGGAVVTGDADLAERVRRLRNYGSPVRGRHDERGVNSRLDELQAAMLRVRLRVLDEWNERRRRTAATYLDRLTPVAADLGLPTTVEWAEPVWHLFVVRTLRRDHLADALAAAGVETAVHYPVPPHRTGAYADGAWAVRDLPSACALAEEVLSLPIGPHLQRWQVDLVCDAVLGAVA